MPRAAMSVATSTRKRPLLKPASALRALRLAAVAVDALAGDAAALEELGEPVGAVLGAREDERVVDRVRSPQQLEQQGGLELLPHRVDRLRDAGGRRRRALDVERHGDCEQLRATAPRSAAAWWRRRSRVCAGRRQVLEHAADVGEEAHVEHAVGLVEHEDLEAGEPGVGVLEVIEQAARAGDDDVDAAAEGALLRLHRDAAVDRGGAEAGVLGRAR